MPRVRFTVSGFLLLISILKICESFPSDLFGHPIHGHHHDPFMDFLHPPFSPSLFEEPNLWDSLSRLSTSPHHGAPPLLISSSHFAELSPMDQLQLAIHECKLNMVIEMLSQVNKKLDRLLRESGPKPNEVATKPASTTEKATSADAATELPSAIGTATSSVASPTVTSTEATEPVTTNLTAKISGEEALNSTQDLVSQLND